MILRTIIILQSTLSLFEILIGRGPFLVLALTTSNNNNKAVLTSTIAQKRDSRHSNNNKGTMTSSGTARSIATTTVLAASSRGDNTEGIDDPETGSALQTGSGALSNTPTTRTAEISAGAGAAMILRDDEPYLYEIPRNLSMSYRPVPILTKSAVCVLSIWFISMLMSFSQVNGGSGGRNKVAKNILLKYPIQFLIEMIETKNVRTILRWSASILIFGVFLTKCIQEYWFPPSRLTIQDMLNQNQEEEREGGRNDRSDRIFPSSLSEYDTVSLRLPDAAASAASINDNDVEEATSDYRLQQEDAQQVELGVHYLKFLNDNDSDNGDQVRQISGTKMEKSSDETRPKFQALYANHGFGASSLSWLPALPKLTKKLSARFGLGHDAVGFGFTERPAVHTSPSNRYFYTSQGSADIGLALLQSHMPLNTANSATKPNGNDPIVLFGHSMGSIATLHMALQLPRDVPKLILLAAPALGLRDKMMMQGRRRQQQQEQRSAPAATPTVGNDESNVVPPRYATTSRSPITAMLRSYSQKMTYPIVCILKLIKSKLIQPLFGAALLLVARVQQFLVRRLFDPIVIYFLRRMVG